MITLTLTMIVGVIVVVAVIVTRMPQALRSTSAPLPSEIILPEGKTAMAVTQGSDWYAIVTTDNHILIFDRATGDLRQDVTISATAP